MHRSPDTATIPSVIERAARDEPAVLALADDERAIDYAELGDGVARLARGLIALGLQPTARVGLWARNGIEAALCHHAALAAGAQIVPINARYTPAEAAAAVVRAGCRMLLADADLLVAAGTMIPDQTAIPDEVALVSLQDTVPSEVLPSGARSRGAKGLDEVGATAWRCSEHELRARTAAVVPDDVSHVQFTSGTTGTPKGAMLRHGAMVATTAAWVEAVGLARGDRYPIVAPFGHIAGHKTGLLACALARATAWPLARPDVERILALGASGRAPMLLQGPPALLYALLPLAETGPRLSLRSVVTGAATIPPELLHRVADVLAPGAIVTAYGLTEASGVCTMTRPGDPLELVATTSGRAIPGVEVRVEALASPDGPDDPDGSDHPDGGEILVRGHNVMAGYLDDPAATAAAVDEWGWLHTGDVGTLDAAGNLRILDRAREIVIVGGLNVYPAEVEGVLAEHPAVEQVAVVGAPHERLGEVPVAFVVAARPPSADELGAWAAARLAPFKIPRTVVAVPDLPLNLAGKVRKDVLRDEARSL